MKSLEIRSKTKDEAINKALAQLNVKSEDLKIEVLENPSKGFLGFLGAKDGLYKFTVIEKETEGDIAKAFVENILKNSNIEADLSVTQEGNVIKVDIKGKDASSLIGRRGETLDSLQYLVSLVINKNHNNSYKRVVLDAENYRKKREETLIRVAQKSAYKVRKSQRPYKLEPMNPYERRIIHSALQEYTDINTHSEGEEPFRRIVISLKK